MGRVKGLILQNSERHGLPALGGSRLVVRDFAFKRVAGTVSLPIFSDFFFVSVLFLFFHFSIFSFFSAVFFGFRFFRFSRFLPFSSVSYKKRNGETPFARPPLRNPELYSHAQTAHSSIKPRAGTPCPLPLLKEVQEGGGRPEGGSLISDIFLEFSREREALLTPLEGQPTS